MKDLLQVYKRFLPYANLDKSLAQEISQLPENAQLQVALEITPNDNQCYPLILKRLQVQKKSSDTMSAIVKE